MENKLGKAAHWVVRLLHFAELPLRHLFKKLDGEPKGPNTFPGPIGTQLANCHNLKIAAFKKINSKNTPVLPPDVVKDLSQDQKYLYKMICAVQDGHVSKQLEKQMPGPICMARWLTLACRLLRLYVTFESAPQELKKLAEFVVRAYGPIWFTIKANSHICDGARHIFTFIEYVAYMPNTLRSYTTKCILFAPGANNNRNAQ